MPPCRLQRLQLRLEPKEARSLSSFCCNNQLLLIEPRRREEGAGRCSGDTGNDEDRLPASVSWQKCSWLTASYTCLNTHKRTQRALSWDSNCPQDQMKKDNHYRDSSAAPQIFSCGAQKPGCCACSDERVIRRDLFDFDCKLLNVIEWNSCLLEHLDVFFKRDYKGNLKMSSVAKLNCAFIFLSFPGG